MKQKISLTNKLAFALSIQISWMLTEKVGHFVKYRLTEIQDKLTKELKVYNDFRSAAITEFADESGNNIPPYIEGKDGRVLANPKLKEYEEKMKPLDEEEIELEVRLLDLSSISKTQDSDKPYTVIYKLFNNDLDKEEQEPKSSSNGKVKKASDRQAEVADK